jgi:predicted nuclease of predicted toxin-antitoxin system
MLLFDQNLSVRLVALLSDLFAGSRHVSSVNLASAIDRQIWDYARENGLTIVSKDSDFHQMSFLFGAPPKTIWLRLGNSSTTQIATALRDHAPAIRDFLARQEEALLVIGRPAKS